MDICKYSHDINARTLLLGASNLFDSGQGGVGFQGAEKVAQVEGVDAFVGAVVNSPYEVYAFKYITKKKK